MHGVSIALLATGICLMSRMENLSIKLDWTKKVQALRAMGGNSSLGSRTSGNTSGQAGYGFFQLGTLQGWRLSADCSPEAFL